MRDLGKDKNIACRIIAIIQIIAIAQMENIYIYIYILSDPTKFVRILDDSFTITLKLEDRISRFLSKLISLVIITEETYKNLFVTGSAPGIIFFFFFWLKYIKLSYLSDPFLLPIKLLWIKLLNLLYR